MAKERRRAVLELLQRPGNTRCADCGAPGRCGRAGSSGVAAGPRRCGAGLAEGPGGCGAGRVRPCEALAGVGAGPGWVRPGVGAGLDARPGDWEESCGACVAGGAGLGCTCMEPDVASQRPGACGCVASPPPFSPTARVSLSPADRRRVAKRRLGRERGNRARRVSAGRERASGPGLLCVGMGVGGSTWLPATWR